jgi:tripartite-type tricarboxylate transporter receptor subunit TctC
MNMTVRRAMLAAAGALAVGTTLLAAQPALAQAYPERAIRMVIPFAPGGGADILARPLSEKLARKLGQPVVIDNKSGAGGLIGTTEVARAKPDGYTLLLNTDAVAIYRHLYRNARIDPLKDLAPVGFVASAPLLLAVNPSLGVSNFKEFVALAKKEPGKLMFANPAVGSPHHLAFELMARTAGIDVGQVAYRGGGQALNDVLAGHAPVGMFTLSTGREYVEAGKLKPLALLTQKRSPLAPELPTIVESGYPDVHVALRFLVLAPAGTPDAVVSRLHAAIGEVSNDAEFKGILKRLGYDSFTTSTPEAAALLRSEYERWGPILKAADIRLD